MVQSTLWCILLGCWDFNFLPRRKHARTGCLALIMEHCSCKLSEPVAIPKTSFKKGMANNNIPTYQQHDNRTTFCVVQLLKLLEHGSWLPIPPFQVPDGSFIHVSRNMMERRGTAAAENCTQKTYQGKGPSSFWGSLGRGPVGLARFWRNLGLN